MCFNKIWNSVVVPDANIECKLVTTTRLGYLFVSLFILE